VVLKRRCIAAPTANYAAPTANNAAPADPMDLLIGDVD
jgi:hypothetical protein